MRLGRFIILAAILCSPAIAGVTYYQGVDVGVATALGPNSIATFNDFAGAVGATSLLDLESVALGTTSGLLANAGGVNVSVSCSGCTGLFNGVVNTQYDELGYNTTSGGSQYFQAAGPAGGALTLTLTFTSTIQELVFYITGIQDFLGTTTFAFDDGAAQSGSLLSSAISLADPVAGSQFLGILTTDSFSSISFTTNSASGVRDIWGFDDLRLAQTVGAVPEPGTLLPLALALAAVGCKLRRRK
jgi:hypothetical protein